MLKIVSLLSLLLILRLGLYYQKESKYSNNQTISFETTLLSDPQVLGRTQRIVASPEGREKIFINTALYPRFNYGDYVRITGTVKERLINNEKTILTMNFPKIEAIKNSNNPVLAITSFIRQKVIFLFDKTLPPTSASLLLGIVFGIKKDMGSVFTDQLRFAGVTHVIAASGMNVSMVGGFLSSILVIFFRRQIALVFSLIGILFYAVLAGLEPSIVRATIMGMVGFSAQILGRQSLAIYGIFIAASLMLFISPNILFEVGFQLSCLATSGLIFIRPLFTRNERVDGVESTLRKYAVIGESLTTTISAQLATLPILLANFGSYSLLSVFANGLVLWTVPWLMVLGGIGAILGFIFEPLAKFFLYLSLPLLLYFQKIVSFFGSTGLKLQINEFPLGLTIGYYLILVSTLIILYQKRHDKNKSAL